MSLYGIIADLRREHPTPGASRTLDMVVSELGRSNDNLRAAVARLDREPIPTGGREVLDELLDRASAEGVDDLERPLPADEAPPVEPVDESQVGIAVLLGGTALVMMVLAALAIASIFLKL